MNFPLLVVASNYIPRINDKNLSQNFPCQERKQFYESTDVKAISWRPCRSNLAFGASVYCSALRSTFYEGQKVGLILQREHSL
jgi:hypothetical protein